MNKEHLISIRRPKKAGQDKVEQVSADQMRHDHDHHHDHDHSHHQPVSEKTGQGKGYWRSLDEFAETHEFQEFVHREFPKHASEWLGSFNRRQFLKVMGASLAFAGLTACQELPNEKIVPYVMPPEEVVPGKPLFFATAMSLGGAATGLLVESHMGRPTKIEGNPEHPASLGATDIFSQASILNLYDPDRAQSVTYLGDIRSWPSFLGAISTALVTEKQRGGAGLRILTETVTSPTLGAQLKEILQAYPQAKWHQYEPAATDMVRAGSRQAFGEDVNTYYNFEKADIIFSIDSDFLSCGPGSLRYAREYARRRRLEDGNKLNRLYVVESTPTNTGSCADHKLPLKPSEMEGFVRAVAAGVGVTAASGATADAKYNKWVTALAKDLQAHRGACVVIAGEYQPPVVHALAHAMNQALGNVGNTVIYTEPLDVRPEDQTQSLRDLVQDMDAGKVELLLIVGGNPVYNAPADLNFAEKLLKVKLRAHLGMYNDETSELCQWHVPEAHHLEAWSDVRTYDGTVSIVQPLIYPLYYGKSAHEMLASLTDKPERNGYDIVRSYWQSQRPGADFEQFWRKVLHDGLMPNTALPTKTPAAKGDALTSPSTGGAQGTEIIFRPDPTVYDGRFANNGWLQECPKPITKLSWDNAVLVSPKMAQKLNLKSRFGTSGGENGESYTDLVEVTYQGRKLEAPAWIVPGQPDDCITVHLGYGRKRAGRVGTGAGFNAYSIRTSGEPWHGKGAQVNNLNKEFPIACAQGHFNIEGRDILRSGTVAEFEKNPSLKGGHGGDHGGDKAAQVQTGNVTQPKPGEHGSEPANKEAHGDKKEHGSTGAGAHGHHPSMYPEYKYEGYAWGMAIDVNSCVGCSACVVACQSENNIPVVGKEQVMNGREMLWLRVDRYYKTADEANPLDNPETYFQPVPCMQCENAPCEVVCPVTATAHSSEGLNDMVYNRCVGTRYCANNCPYKVRRFNFLQFSDFETPSLKLLRNPDVTVRSRGVMEKCTYCVQRINYARVEAEKEDRPIRDGEIMTACQSVCPTEAIVFGNINDPNSRVAKIKATARNYSVLDEINTKPRTTYLGAVRNPNPEIGHESGKG